MLDDLIPVKEAAQMCGVDVKTIRNHIKAGTLPVGKRWQVGPKRTFVLLHLADVEAFKASRVKA